MSNNLEAPSEGRVESKAGADSQGAGLSSNALTLMKEAQPAAHDAAAAAGSAAPLPHFDTSSLYPDPKLTPGAVFPDVTEAEVCRPGYSSGVRNVPASVKAEVFREYGITPSPGQYEVDHFISLELGGSNDISNLWPEPYEPRPGAHEKDAVENYLHKQVCSNHSMTLKEAQDAISTDWYKVYQQMKSGN